MAVTNRIDPGMAAKRLSAWLAPRLRAESDVSVTGVIVPKASGMSCETVIFSARWKAAGVTRDERMVARVAPDPDDWGDSLFPEYDLHLETEIMRAVRSAAAVPAPEVMFLEDDPTVLGGPFMIMKHITGRVPPGDPPYTASGWVLTLDSAEQRQLVENTVDILAALHSVPWDQLRLPGLDRRGSGAPGAEQYVGRIRHLFETGCRGRSHPTIEAGIEWAQRHRPKAEGPLVLNWGDTRVGNVLYADDLSVAGVLDWEMACVATRDQDLAYLLFTFDLMTRGRELPWPPGFPTESEVVDRYERQSGYQASNLGYYKGLSALMAAVMLMRIGYIGIEAGLLPCDSAVPSNNPASRLMTAYLGLPGPEGAKGDYIGVR